MTVRALMCGLCVGLPGLLALPAGGFAQKLAAIDPGGNPVATDASPKMPNVIPEIIRPAPGDEVAHQYKLILDPETALRPPPVNTRLLRDIHVGALKLPLSMDIARE
jgi:hypothetical protein